MTGSQIDHGEHPGASLQCYSSPAFPSSDSSLPSISSSSSSSVFSVESQSSHSSAPSSSRSLQLPWETETNNSGYSSDFSQKRSRVSELSCSDDQTAPKGERSIPLPKQLRLNPRRTNSAAVESGAVFGIHQPPSLIRQCDRKDNFVESLVDTTTHMIEVIWPLSTVSCGRDANINGKNLIGLRTFIQEVLKRSKTSYSTLQVALYYLVLIKPFVPKIDFTKPQIEDTHASRAMQCGRRMFLAALILASKYLQDRNYSARAWSKISGLKIAEINSNEIAFVTAIDWKLHVPESRFQRWTDVVLKYSQTSSALPLQASNQSTWRSVIPHLTPDLDGFRSLSGTLSLSVNKDLANNLNVMSPPSRFSRGNIVGTSNSKAPTLSKGRPLALEPLLYTTREQFSFPPISPRLSQLPTPQITSSTQGFCTPAENCISPNHRGSAMCGVMKQIHNLSMLRSTLDTYPGVKPNTERSSCLVRASNLFAAQATCTSSTMSSPESMISDTSSTSSRTSSSSSVSSLTFAGAPLQATRLALLANRRFLSMSQLDEETMNVYDVMPGAAQESYVRGDKTEIISGPLNVTSSETEYERMLYLNTGSLSNRKRERPLSATGLQIEDDVRSIMAQISDIGNDLNNSVVGDISTPNSITLREECTINCDGKQVRLGHLSSDHQVSRKRMRCQYREYNGSLGQTITGKPLVTNKIVLPQGLS